LSLETVPRAAAVSPMTKARKLGGLAALLVLAPAGAWAQATGSSTEPPRTGQDGGQATPSLPTDEVPEIVPEAKRPPRWVASIGLRTGWDSNPLFSETDPQGSWTGGMTGQFAYAGRYSRGNLSLVGDGAMVRYSDVNQLNEFVYGARANGSWKANPRLDLTFDQSFSSTYTHQNQALVESGLVLPQAVVQRLETAVTAARRLAPRTTLNAVGRYQRVWFPNGELTNGSEATAGLGLSRQLNRGDSVSVAYAYVNDAVPGPSGSRVTNDIQNLTAGWSHQLAQRWSGSLSGGIAVFVPTGETSRSVVPQGAASIERKTARWSLGGHYSRSVSQAFGLGRQRIADVVGATLTLTMTRKVSGGLVYTKGWNRDPGDSQYSFNDDAVGADLRWTLYRRLVATGSYSFRRSTGATGADTALTGNVVALSLSYVQEWR
jgi:hypothetical protein